MKQYGLLVKEKNFLVFISAISLIYLAQSIVDVAIIWLVYEKTQQPLFIALSVFITQVPSLISAPFLGGVMDKIAVSKAISLASLVKAFVFIVLCLLSTHINNLVLIVLALLLILNSAVSPLISAGSIAIVKDLLDDEQFHTANALVNISFDVCYLLGAFLSGLIIAQFNHQLIFLCSALLFFLATLLLSLIPSQRHQKQEEDNGKKRPLLQALQYLTSIPKLLSLVCLTSLWNLLIWGAFPIVFPIFVKTILQEGAATYGLINGVQSFGIIIGSLIVGGIPKHKNSFHLTFLFLMAHCVLIAIFSLQNNVLSSMILLIVAGVISSPVMIYKSTFFQETIPDQLKGRIFSIIGLLGTVTYPIGNFLTALLLNGISAENVGILLFTYAIILLLLSVALFAVFYRKANHET
ncbi:MFS transporter [Streptococcus sp. sy010]|uniref:MFS transporter n=1 Tax=Streptococcus sp. sy010 TaxID=2600148 RepID=UPI0011B3DDC9|nr:MFS transporter [Streptococcus sp. sy010]TWT14467.1 MFS transporter [Streptococcus sp. sy010]